ncbi:MAG: FAD-dependent oxidoreductase [Pseudomonadota bacterium]
MKHADLCIVGAGHAAGQLAVSLRQTGFDGSVLMAGEETYPPYQRPPLSKKFLAGELASERLFLKPAEFYTEAEITLALGATVSKVDTAKHTANIDRLGEVSWSQLVFATGSRVRRLAIPGEALAGVHYLRSIRDTDAIRAAFKPGRKVVIIGGGYLGLEIAAVAATAGLTVTVLEQSERLLSRVVSPPLSEFYEDVHTQAGVDVRTGVGAIAFEGDDAVAQVITQTDEAIAADLVIVAIGVVPNVELAQDAGVACDNGIRVDEYCRTDVDDVLAIGECTNHPNPLLNRRLRLESVPNALDQARTAAATLTGELKPYSQVPWFWSDQYDLKLQMAGLIDGYDTHVLRGDPATRQFASFYLREGGLIAMDAVNSPKDFLFAKPLIADQRQIPQDKLADPDYSLKQAAVDYPG